MPFKKQYRKPYKQPPPSPIEISFWEAAKPLIPELENEVWIDKKYRVDFLIPSKKVIIELYGFQYHNTKSKITKDAERERYLQRAGYKVIRFTGTEIYKDVQKCVSEVLALANIQPAPRITKTAPTPTFEQAASRNWEKPGNVAVNSVSYFTDRASQPLKPVNQLSVTSKSKKKILGMETWQIATLGVMAVVLACIVVFLAMLILNSKVV